MLWAVRSGKWTSLKGNFVGVHDENTLANDNGVHCRLSHATGLGG